MAPVRKIEIDVEVKSPVDKYWANIMDSTTLFPKIFPELYKSIEVLEGDGKSVGSVRLVHYGEENPAIKTAKERIDSVDEGSKLVVYSVIGGDLAHCYKTFKAHWQVTPKGDGSLVKWFCEFEKVTEEVPDPELKDFVTKNFHGLDAYLLKA